MSDLYDQEWDRVPAPGEAIVTHFVDTNKTELKIGDGIRTLRELPYIKTETPKETINIEYPIDKFIDLIPPKVWKLAEEESSWEKDGIARDDEILESAIAMLADTFYLYYGDYWNEQQLPPF